uniref:Uncharacterized protein n=1 Tax=Anguilla anguilla TaxID=7936 RepID=A0A0E9V0G4_ANGAN
MQILFPPVSLAQLNNPLSIVTKGNCVAGCRILFLEGLIHLF